MWVIEPTVEGLIIQDYHIINEESDRAREYGHIETCDNSWPSDGLSNYM